MKWRDLYHGLTIRKQEDQPDCDIPDFFSRMSEGAVFALTPFHEDRDARGTLLRHRYCPQNAKVKILSIQVKPQFTGLTILCRFVDILPPGFKHGVFALDLEDGRFIFALPDDLFVDGNAPAGELSEWKEEPAV